MTATDQEEEIKTLIIDLGEIQKVNQKLFTDAQHAGAGIDPMTLFAVKFDLFLSMLPKKDRLVLELAFERQMQGILVEMGKQARQSKLLQGVNFKK